MNFKKTKFTLLLLIVLRISDNCLAMEADNANHTANIVIVNQNAGQNIEEYIKTEKAHINIFGTTIRYSFFDRYQKLLIEHLDKLIKARKTRIQHAKKIKPNKKAINIVQNNLSRPIKHVEKSKGQAVYNIMQKINENSFEDYMQNLDLETKFQIFKKFGLQQDNLLTNFKKLVHVADFNTNKKYLIHVLMPSYLHDLHGYFANGTLTYELLEEFLIECAKFYKSMYLNALENALNQTEAHLRDIKIVILIPDVKYIKQLIEASVLHSPTTEKLDRQEKANNTTDVLVNEIFDRLNKDNFYYLINTDKTSMSEILKCLQNKQINNLTVVELPIQAVTSFGCKKVQTFFPYILRRIKKYSDFRSTPLVHKELADFINTIKRK